MKILIVKTSSLGDVIHTLPALTDAAQHYPNIHFDWVVEENFSEIPAWHLAVNRVIPIAWRRWRKDLRTAWQEKQLQTFYKTLRETQYDKIIDAQGLFKSAIVARLAKGRRCGLDYYSARESFASCLYQSCYSIARTQHAITRTRELFAWSLGYAIPLQKPDYAIHKHFVLENHAPKKSIILVHGTTWTSKEWPEDFWIALAKRCVAEGWEVQIPWGNAAEKLRAERIASHDAHMHVLPRSTLTELATLLLQATAVIAVDTGIGHLAAALSVPTISLYGPTDPVKIGALGDNQQHLRKTNQMADISVDAVWEKLTAIAS